MHLLPEIDSRAVISWTGSFGSSPNGMPTIGAIPGYPRCYAVMGYGGNGITFSMLASKLITAAVWARSVLRQRCLGFSEGEYSLAGRAVRVSVVSLGGELGVTLTRRSDFERRRPSILCAGRGSGRPA